MAISSAAETMMWTHEARTPSSMRGSQSCWPRRGNCTNLINMDRNLAFLKRCCVCFRFGVLRCERNQKLISPFMSATRSCKCITVWVCRSTEKAPGMSTIQLVMNSKLLNWNPWHEPPSHIQFEAAFELWRWPGAYRSIGASTPRLGDSSNAVFLVPIYWDHSDQVNSREWWLNSRWIIGVPFSSSAGSVVQLSGFPTLKLWRTFHVDAHSILYNCWVNEVANFNLKELRETMRACNPVVC